MESSVFGCDEKNDSTMNIVVTIMSPAINISIVKNIDPFLDLTLFTICYSPFLLFHFYEYKKVLN